MRWVAAGLALICLCGCAPVERKTVRGPGGSATIERRGDRTRLSASGTDEMVEVRPAEVMKEIDLPVFPGARVVPGSQYCAVSRERGDRTYSARVEAAATFEQVLDWYAARLNSKPIKASIVGRRTALVSRTEHKAGRTRSVMISTKRNSKDTDITLVLVIRGD